MEKQDFKYQEDKQCYSTSIDTIQIEVYQEITTEMLEYINDTLCLYPIRLMQIMDCIKQDSHYQECYSLSEREFQHGMKHAKLVFYEVGIGELWYKTQEFKTHPIMVSFVEELQIKKIKIN